MQQRAGDPGCACDRRRDGEGSAPSVDEEAFDVLVADVGMPEQDGYALIRAVRGRPESSGSHIPAIAVTAYAGPRERAKALAPDTTAIFRSQSTPKS